MTSRSTMFALLFAASVSTPSAIAAETQPAVGRYRIAYATFIGGSQFDQLREIIRLPDGSVLVGGQTSSPDLPITEGVVQPTYGGEPAGAGHPGVSGGDCFVACLDPQGRHFAFVTYFGGSRQERAVYGMALDKRGNIIIATGCRSHDLPTTDRAYQRRYGGGKADVMLAKLAPDARSTIWCTYIGGRGNDWPRGGIALDQEDNVVIVGRSDSPDFPGTDGVLRLKVSGAEGDAMVVKMRAGGTGLVWATLLGGSNWDGLMGARVDAAGNVYVAGHTRSTDLPVTPSAAQPTAGGESDCSLASLSPDGRRLRYCTYLAGSGNEFAEHRPALLGDGSVLLTGVTASANFPTTDNAYQKQLKGKTDGFVAKVSPDGTKFAFCTLLGGSGGEFFLMPTVGADGNICIVGHTDSRDFPVTPDALQKTYGGGKGDAVLAILSSDGSKLLYATYLGGSGDDLIRSVTLGENGTLYLAGNSNSDDFPISAHAAQRTHRGNHDGVIVKLEPAK